MARISAALAGYDFLETNWDDRFSLNDTVLVRR